MRRLLLLAALLASLFAPALAGAAGFTDDFSSDPFRYPRRWCARSHGAEWNRTNGTMDVWKDTSTTARVTTTGCCAYSPTAGCEGHGTTDGRYLIRTALPYAGNKRVFRVRFALPANFTSTDTLEVYGAAHPYCNAGVKATLSSPGGDGLYQLTLAVADSAGLSPSTECAYNGGSALSFPPSDLFALTADAVNLNRYEILLRLDDTDAGAKVEGTVKLYDRIVDPNVIVPGAKVANKRFTRPVWYGRHANYFAFGGNKASGAKTPITLAIGTAK